MPNYMNREDLLDHYLNGNLIDEDASEIIIETVDGSDMPEKFRDALIGLLIEIDHQCSGFTVSDVQNEYIRLYGVCRQEAYERYAQKLDEGE